MWFDVDVEGIFEKVKELRNSILGTREGASSSPVTVPADHNITADSDVRVSNSNPSSAAESAINSAKTRSILTTLLLAMTLTKLFSPIKVMLAAGITPMVAKKLRTMGFEVGGKGLRNTVRGMKERSKEVMKKRNHGSSN